MISLSLFKPKKPVSLRFQSELENVAHLGDIDEIEYVYSGPLWSAKDGTYYIDGDSLVDANVLYIDAYGTLPSWTYMDEYFSTWMATPGNMSTTYNSTIPNPNGYWAITDMNGNVARYNPSNHAITDHYTSESIKLPGAFQTIAFDPAASGIHEILYTGVMYGDTTAFSTTTRVSSTPYQMGHMTKNAAGHWIMNISEVGNIKSVRWTNNPSTYLSLEPLLAFSSLAADAGGPPVPGGHTYDVANLPCCTYPSYSSVREHVQLDYILDVESAGCATFSSSWYIQYGPYQNTTATFYPGTMNSFAYPLYGLGETPMLSNRDYGKRQDHGVAPTFDSKLLIKSGTPNATGGDDNGDGDAGWYRPTGDVSGKWSYFNGFKWMKITVCF